MSSSFRFGSRSEHSRQSVWKKDSQGSDFFSGHRNRTVLSKPNDKGKQPVYDGGVIDYPSPTSISTFSALVSTERFSPSRRKSLPPVNTRPSTADSTRKPRGSLLVAASDSFGFKFGRKTPSTRLSPMPTILSEVIEISAARRDEEVEERNRLRDMAAQSIGIPATMHPLNRSLDTNSEVVKEEEEEEGAEGGGVTSLPSSELERRHLNNARVWETPSPFGLASRSLQGSSVSIPNSSSGLPNRLRSGSLLTHSRTNSITVPLIPSFPTTLVALAQCKQLETILFKFYPPSSLRIFALHKNWRSRHMVLSSPAGLVRRNSSPPVSYLHLFKTSGGSEREMERLEINEDSVVFVAEGGVGGRNHVVKVAGVDVGALKKELNHEEGGRTMWFLHISNPTDAQRWITAIKTVILGQRTMRAGLGMPNSSFTGTEPRGDMDVMLSIRAQALITSPTSTTNSRSVQSVTPIALPPDSSYASSISSHRSVPKPMSLGSVSAVKGLFTGSTRPRSTSRATSIDLHDTESVQDESFTSIGSHFLGTTSPNLGDGTLKPRRVVAYKNLPFGNVLMPVEHRLDQKIIPDRTSLWPSSDPLPVTRERSNRTLSLQAVSLRPPPRKRWTSLGPADQDNIESPTNNSNWASDNEIRPKAVTELASSLTLTKFAFGSPVQRPRPPSVQSVSTLASGDNGLSFDRSSTSTKQSSKRWSRQGVLPRQLTPPSGAPPSVPISQANDDSHGPALANLTPSERSSRNSASSRQSVISSLPSFPKRTSGSSFLSIAATPSNSSSPSISRPASSHSHRISMPPPPRPPPTSALPPAPAEDEPKSDSLLSSKSFRDSVAHRASRLSLIAPKPPPSTVLPPRPDEVGYKSTQRRNSSAGNYSHSKTIDTIPASPIPRPTPSPSFSAPLTSQRDTPLQSSLPVSRRTSIKQRLRILSVPSSPPALSPSTPAIQLVTDGSPFLTSSTGTSVGLTTLPLPPTPIAEKIVQYQNDLSFLKMPTVTNTYLPPRILPPQPEPYSEAGIISLSPPPRRASKQMSIVEIESEVPVIEGEKVPVEGEHRLISLSRPGSVISLGILSM